MQKTGKNIDVMSRDAESRETLEEIFEADGNKHDRLAAYKFGKNQSDNKWTEKKTLHEIERRMPHIYI